MKSSRIALVLVTAWLAAIAGSGVASAQTYISAEPIPSPDVVGGENLAAILGIGYSNLELWSQRLNSCGTVQDVIQSLTSNGAIRTVIFGNTRYGVAAGGFQGVTDPSFVFRMQDSGPAAVSPADVFVLNNALGYVLSQDGTAQFSLRLNPNDPNVFPLDYGVVTFNGSLTGVHAQKFFDYLGTFDVNLWSGTNAGFTQIALNDNGLNDSMLFLIGDVSKQEFVTGLSAAASTTFGAKYSPLGPNGKPTTATAGVAFPGNDWLASPGGQGYLSNIGNASPELLQELGLLRLRHLRAVANLLRAINNRNVGAYLNSQFRCP